jgi:hypothetical protein
MATFFVTALSMLTHMSFFTSVVVISIPNRGLGVTRQCLKQAEVLPRWASLRQAISTTRLRTVWP